MLLTVVAVPASAASPTLTPKITSCTTTRTSVTVHWVTAKTPASAKITGYDILTAVSQSATRTIGRKARAATVHGLSPRTAYRIQLYPFLSSGFPTIPTCLAYTKLKSGKKTTPMLHPMISTVTATSTTISVTWTSGESATSALPSSYGIFIFSEDNKSAPTVTVPEPLSVQSATVSGLLPGTSYYVSVGTINAWGEASVSSLIETAQPISTTTTSPTTTTSLPTTTTTS